jgi:RNA polymerase sigma-70 factor, ECF subfamily
MPIVSTTEVYAIAPIAPHLTDVARDNALRYDALGNSSVGSRIVSLASMSSASRQPVVQDQDVELIRRVAAKDGKAFEQLYYLYAPRIGRYVSRLLKQREQVDEVVNDVLMVVWQNAAQFDATASRLSTWMFGIAHNKCLKAMEQTYRRANEVTLEIDSAGSIEGSSDPLLQADTRNPERTVMGWQLGRELLAAVEALSPEHRAVIELTLTEDYSYEDVARILACPVNTVKTRMHYARKRLAALLARRGVDT